MTETTFVEEDVEVKTRDGALPCFAVHPEGEGPFPAVILYMDAPGIREELRDFSRRIASHGYFCLLPDMYYRNGTFRWEPATMDRAQMREQMNSLSNALVAADTESMLAFLDAHASVAKGPKGAIGYCMSGQYVVTAAGAFPDAFGAVAALHGVGIVTDKEDSPHLLASGIKAELYFGFAEVDPTVPDFVIPTLKETLDREGVTYRCDVWPGTRHGFAFPSREVYQEEAAEGSWKIFFEICARRLEREAAERAAE